MRHEKIILRDGAHQHWHKMAAVKMQLLFETRGSKTFVKTSKIVQRNCQRYLRNFEGDAGEAVVEATEGAGNEAGGEATEGAGGEAIEEGAGGEAVGLAAGETAEGAGGEATEGADSEANEAAANEFFEAAANEAFEEAGAEAEVEALMETMLATVVRFAEIAAGEVAVIPAGEAMETVEDSAMEEEGETFKDFAMQEVDDVTMEETVGDAPVEEAAADVTMEEAVDRRSADFLRAKTGEEKWIVERALYEIGPETEIIAKFDSDACQRASLQGLPNEWLNDEDTHMMGLRDEQLVNEGKRSRRSHFFKSDFMTELTNDGDTEKDGVYEYRNVKHCSKQVPGKDIFLLDKIAFLVNVGRNHWVVVVAFMQLKRIQFYNSFGDAGLEWMNHVLQYIKDEHLDKKKVPLPDADQWELVSCAHASKWSEHEHIVSSTIL